MERTVSQKHKDHLLHDGYRLRRDRVMADGGTSWRCSRKDCSGRVKVSQHDIVVVVSEHNHAPGPDRNEAHKVVVEIRRRAVTTVEKPRQIIQQTTAAVPLEVASHLPEYTASQRMIQRQRKRHAVPYGPVNSLADIVIPDSLKQTTRNEDFLLWDSGDDDEKRILMFGTLANLELLQQHHHWFIDGTFKVAPTIYYQVFTIHALIDASATPLIYVLLPDKSEDDYVRVLRKLEELKPTLNPASIMSDFEKASQNACSSVFPGAQLVGCLFHLGQNLWRKIQQLNLTTAYRDDEHLRMHVKMMLALSFVPVADVPAAFDVLVDDCPPLMMPLTEYWEDTYIGRQRRGRRANPRFALLLWNMRDRVIDNLPRTNNSVEAWHRSFQQTVDCHHPSVYKLIEHFRQEQDHYELKIERFRAGFRQPESSKSKYVRLNRRLKALVPTYGTVPVADYLRGIAHNINI